MLEAEVESHLVILVTKSGGLCIKWVPQGKRGWPDRIVLYPGKPPIFVELKRPGEKPRGQQLLRHEELSRLGYQVVTLDCKKKVEEFVETIHAPRLPVTRN